MSRKPISPSILEAAKQFDSQLFADTVKGEFSDFPDYRRNQKRVVYPIWYLALVVLCGFFCGCNTTTETAEYAELQEEWFASLLGQSFGTPCPETLWWFTTKSPPEIMKTYLRKWVRKVPGSLRNQLLAIDGKRLRGATHMGHITHVVELFAAEDRLCLAMEKVPNKAVEKSTIPDILRQVDVEDAIISADAHFTVSESAKQIIEAKADYLLAVKGNQPTLHAEMENFFDQAHAIGWDGVSHDFYETTTKDHGRIEVREIRVVEDIDWLPDARKWEKLACLIEVRSTRQKTGSAETEKSRRLYISSRQGSAKNFAQWIQQHWSIENQCHWVLDVIFREDAALADRGAGAENLALFRRLAMNMAAVADPGRGLASVRRSSAFSKDYLKGVLAMIFCPKSVKTI